MHLTVRSANALDDYCPARLQSVRCQWEMSGRDAFILYKLGTGAPARSFYTIHLPLVAYLHDFEWLRQWTCFNVRGQAHTNPPPQSLQLPQPEARGSWTRPPISANLQPPGI